LKVATGGNTKLVEP